MKIPGYCFIEDNIHEVGEQDCLTFSPFSAPYHEICIFGTNLIMRNLGLMSNQIVALELCIFKIKIMHFQN